MMEVGFFLVKILLNQFFRTKQPKIFLLKEFIDDSISVGMIALSDKGEGVGIANTDMPWSTWIGS